MSEHSYRLDGWRLPALALLVFAATTVVVGILASCALATNYLEEDFKATATEHPTYGGLLSEVPAASCEPESTCLHWTRWEGAHTATESGEQDEATGNPVQPAHKVGAPAPYLDQWHIQESPQNVVISPYIWENLIELGIGESHALPPAPAGEDQVAWFGNETTGTYCGESEAEVKKLHEEEVPQHLGCTSKGEPEGALVSPEFSLATAGSAYLRFDTWWEIESYNPDVKDVMSVDYSTDGGATWAQAAPLNQAARPKNPESEGIPYSDMGLQRQPEWEQDVVDLSGVPKTTQVEVRFRFNTNNPLYNGFRGWAIDNVSVSSEAPPAPKITGCSIGASGTPVIEGSGFLLGSKVKEDEYEPEATLAQSATRIELPLNFFEGRQRLQVIGPEGGTGDSEAVLVDVTPSSCALVKEETTTSTTTTSTTSTTTSSYPAKAATERGNPVVDLRNGEIEGEFDFPEAGTAEWAGVVSQGASLARVSSAGMASLADPLAALEAHSAGAPARTAKAKRCRKGFVKKNGRCVNNAPVAYGHASLTASAAGRYRLIIKPSAKVRAALKQGRRLSVRLTFTFTPAHTSVRLTHSSTVSVHVKASKAKR